MIATDLELKTTQERICYFQNLLAQMRARAAPEEFPSMSSGFRCEIERMHTQVMEYLSRHASQLPVAQATDKVA